MKFIKAHWPLVVGLGLPIVLILVIFGAYYWPSRTVKPTQDFVYVLNNYGYPGSSFYYTMNGNTLTQEKYSYDSTVPAPKREGVREPELYYHDVETNQGKKISYEEARVIKLNPETTSKDGFMVTWGGGNGFFFDMFGSSYDYNTRYLVKGAYKDKINIADSNVDGYSGPKEMQFLGWVE